MVESEEVEILDLNEYQAEIFNVDKEKVGFPDNLVQLSKKMKSYDGFIISLAEHNGSYTSAFKNTLDWLSRIEREDFNNKPMLLTSASPGGRGGASVQDAAQAYFPRLGADIVATFLFPNFYVNFSKGKITNLELNKILEKNIEELISKL